MYILAPDSSSSGEAKTFIRNEESVKSSADILHFTFKHVETSSAGRRGDSDYGTELA